jgi:predicted S18 family serine protease
MKRLADMLCSKTKTLIPRQVSDNESVELNQSAHNMTLKSAVAYDNSDFYSAASYCYGANVKYRLIDLIESNYSQQVLHVEAVKTAQKIEEMEKELEQRELTTITDLQTYVIVRERLIEASENIDKFFENESELMYLANAYERTYSAESWSEFFALDGEELEIDEQSLRESCMIKLREAEERFQYLNLILPSRFQETRKDLDETYNLSSQGEYALCLFKASKAKAQINVVLSSIGFKEDNLGSLIDLKLEAVRQVINSQVERDLFPIVGYSYYEYASNLKDSDKSSALLYSEYALELSRLDLYFKEKEKALLRFSTRDKELILMLVIGLVVGFASGLIFRRKK